MNQTDIEFKPSRTRTTHVVPPNDRPIRAFLAEDCPLLMVLLARLLARDRRISIVGSATDGQKALRCASTLQVDLVVTDLHMPGLDGAAITRLLKQRPNPPVVIVVTSDDTPEATARCQAAGADVFLVKARNLAVTLPAATQEFFPDDLEPKDGEPRLFYERHFTAE